MVELDPDLTIVATTSLFHFLQEKTIYTTQYSVMGSIEIIGFHAPLPS